MGKELTKQRTQEHEQRAWRLRTTGFSQWQIAEQMGISQPAVSKILNRVGKRLAAEFREEALAVKMAQTELLDRIAAEALAAWQLSKKDAETTSVVRGRVSKDGLALPELVTHTVSGQVGNPSYLQQVRGALADIRSLWGLDAPQRQEHSGPGGAPIPVISEVVVELPSEADPAGGRPWEDERGRDAPASNGTTATNGKTPAEARLELVVELPHE